MTTTGAATGAHVHEVITVTGARENNLRDISLTIPKRRLTVFTGVSGSGKSSLVFSTLAAESRRLVNATYDSFVQGFMPTLSRPDVDALTGLTPAIVVDQERLGANPRSTLGTASDLGAHLRVLFSRLSTPHVGGPQAFAFNVPTVTGGGAVKTTKGGRTVTERKHFTVTGGMCPRCDGTGRVSDINLAELYDENLSLTDGALKIPGYTPDGYQVKALAQTGLFPADVPIKDFTPAQLDALLYQEPTKVRLSTHNWTYEGLVPKLRSSMLAKDPASMQPHVRAFVERAVVYLTCPDCEGTRLDTPARTAELAGTTIAQACAMPLSELATWIDGLLQAARGEDAAPAAAREVTGIRGALALLERMSEILSGFVRIGLGYLSLDRPASTLSGGEAQRMKLVRHLSSALTDVTYVFDEPSIGLHPHDVHVMVELLRALRDKGNTVLVVEHKPEVIAAADHVIDLGPGAGAEGGHVTYAGSLAGLASSGTLTGTHLTHRTPLKPFAQVRAPRGVMEIRHASTNNLKDVDVDIPRGVLTVVTGVAGSGKSSLIHGHLSAHAQVVTLDQSPLKGSRRSSPATYTGLLDPLRQAFAKANGVKPALFSANSEGACPVCQGAGVIDTQLGFMETVSTTCEACEGRRYSSEVLEYTFAGMSIADMLDLSVTQAHDLLTAPGTRVPAAVRVLTCLRDAKLGYLRLGQAVSTLSGGEQQRLRLAQHLAQLSEGGDEVLVLDEPTTGLHLADVDALLAMLDRLVDSGRSVVVIEHHQAVMAHADWIIDLGPGAGREGGRVVFTGTPAQLVSTWREHGSLTGDYLERYVTGTGTTS